MFSLTGAANNNNNQNKQVTPRFFPGNTSLNKNADGLICSINTQNNNVHISRFESRIEFYRNQKPQTTASIGLNSTGFGQQAQTQQQPGLFGQPQQQQPGMFGQAQQQQPGLFGQPQQSQPGLFGQPQQQQQQTGLNLGGTGLGTGLGMGTNPGLGQQQTQQGFGQQPFGQTTNTGLGTNLGGGLGTSIGALGQNQPTGLGFGQQQPQQTGLGFGAAQPTQPSTGLFGQTQPSQGTGIFGAQAGGTLLGQAQQPGTGLFGGNTSSGISFGGAQAQPTQAQSLMVNSNSQQTQMMQQQQYGMNSGQQNYNPAYPQYNEQINIDFDFKNEQEYLKEIEDEFKKKIPTFSEYASNNKTTVSVGNLNFRFNQPLSIKISQQKNKSKVQDEIKQWYGQPSLSHINREVKYSQSKKGTLSINNQATSQITNSIIQSITQKSEIIQPKQTSTFKNHQAPKCSLYNLQPSIEQLEQLSDIQLTKVKDFQISNQFGVIQFLEPVDLRNLNIDEIVKLEQDSVEFYPDDNQPEVGKQINVKCKITFKNFAHQNRKMCELKLNSHLQYSEIVKKWAEKNNMNLISVDEDVVVELNQL